ncbi:MAG: glycine dehydrogenase (aminomethyl-transferring), partial [Ilumatobacter coccineus]
PLDHLYRRDEFVGRHIGPSESDLAQMLNVIGVDSVDDLLEQAVPTAIREAQPLALEAPKTEHEVLAELRDLAHQNTLMTSMIGMGYYGTFTPPVILRNVVENPAWYTAYTPYQPEISQGRLEGLVTFQTMVANLTGLDVANASLLDEATAAAEAMAMAFRISRGRRNRFFVHHDVHPQTLAVLTTRSVPIGVELVVGDLDALVGDGFCGALFSYPTSTGSVTDWTEAIERAHDLGAQAIVATDLLACVSLRSPGAMGADVAIGSSQRFGVPMGYGGPHAGFMAVRESSVRTIPGRLVGVSTDTKGRPALRLALQTREQHIRRQKATSNICTAQALLANVSAFYAMWHGPQGLTRIADRVRTLAALLADHLTANGFTLRHERYFDTIVLDGVNADEVLASARQAGINLRRVDDSSVGISIDETTEIDTLVALVKALGVDAPLPTDVEVTPVPDGMARDEELLPQQIFRTFHSEHQMLRYLRRLADRDLALDRTMIPLGSCTMKLNSASEMMPITWPEFADVHPAAPDDQTVGYRAMIADLEAMLVEITGYDAVTIQPNAGSQGEFAGLMAIRRYHHSRDDDQRNVCLIPSSAHGTNAASAVMAGYDVVVVKCDDDGNVDIEDLKAKIDKVGDRLSAIMITYPSTHGVFETGVREVCDLVHAAGGQVYVDGANLNALVGIAKPGHFGADVSHLNLHKTFAIPHGGGGPGVGPVGVRSHLVPFLPGDPLSGDHAVSAARFGSASVLPISWSYLKLMGASGLRKATSMAIVNANYLATRLGEAYPVLYTGHNDRVAHECIIDLRQITHDTGVTVDDVAKRLIDFGIHAPTMSFPVAGTFMIEPTESEDLGELDRFCDAMLTIRAEIEAIAGGADLESSALHHAPHTAEDLIGEWDRPYSREEGAFPAGMSRVDKYFPPVSRIDGASGDRHLMCSCEPLEAYAEGNTDIFGA